MTTTPKHRLRWYQYSLRSLFVLTVLVAIAGSWFAIKRQQVERQRAAVKWVKEMDGLVHYDWMFDADGKQIPNAAPPGPAWLRAWLGDDFFARVVVVGRLGEEVTDAGLERLEGLTQLDELYLQSTRVTDAGLEHLKGMTQLRSLYLDNTRVTDAGLEQLRGMMELKYLSLKNTQVTDGGREHLKGLTQLKYLHLEDTRVTDAGLEHLKGLTQLRMLYLSDTKVTEEGFEKLRQALPNCYIIRVIGHGAGGEGDTALVD